MGVYMYGCRLSMYVYMYVWMYMSRWMYVYMYGCICCYVVMVAWWLYGLGVGVSVVSGLDCCLLSGGWAPCCRGRGAWGGARGARASTQPGEQAARATGSSHSKYTGKQHTAGKQAGYNVPPKQVRGNTQTRGDPLRAGVFRNFTGRS